MQLTVFGAETPCPSCLHSPSSFATMEWLDAAVNRKFPDDTVEFRYVDIYHPINDEDHYFTEKIVRGELFYPLVVAEGKVISEGDPHLQTIFQFLDSHRTRALNGDV